MGVEAIGGSLAAMGGAVVPDPEDASCRLVGRLAHNFAHEAIHRCDAILGFAAAEDFGAVDLPAAM
jgi:hypothetical protein